MRSSKYTAELLGPIVATSKSRTEVLRRLGLQPTGGNFRYLAARIRIAGLDTSHFAYGKNVAKSLDVSRDVLAPLVEESGSFAQVLTKLGLPTNGRPVVQLRRRIDELGLDISHFHGSAWARGYTKATHPSLARASQKQALPNPAIFIENGPMMNGQKLIPRLLALGWSYRCEWCGISEWRNKRLVLHVDHINGINNDNRLENLRFLCPNCHSQTDTYCNRAREEAACYMLSTDASVLEW